MDITKIFENSVKDDTELKEALQIIDGNFKGRAWLIGSSVYKNIAGALYGSLGSIKDFDFIVENPVSKISLPADWKLTASSFGNQKFVKNNSYSIDFVPLNKIHSIIKRKLESIIENYLTGVPLTVQSIAYDIRHKKVIGDIGIAAILKKEVEINDADELANYCKLKNITAENYLKEKAKSLKFTPVYPKK